MDSLRASSSKRAGTGSIMLLPWLSQDGTGHDQVEQDEASEALLPKVSDDKLPRGGIFQENSEGDVVPLTIESKKLPWWSYIWVRPLKSPQLSKADNHT
jgi:ACS family pantothenate transporter-like MFS transporter